MTRGKYRTAGGCPIPPSDTPGMSWLAGAPRVVFCSEMEK